MPILPPTLNTIGLVLLTHAIYSTHEHTTTSPIPNTPLPTDIIIELLFSTLLLTTGIVLSSSPLKPIHWANWAGKLSREGPKEGVTREGEEVFGDGDPFAFLGVDGSEGRMGFWDGRGRRAAVEGWVRGGAGR